MTEIRPDVHEPAETSELAAFVHVVDEGSVSGAARRLGLPRATVSRRLARLEERLGVRLLHRTTRQLNITESGEEYYTHARAILAAVAGAAAAVRRSDDVPRGLLRVSIPPAGDARSREAILAFVEAWPEVQLELISSTRIEDLRARNIDVAWRATASLDPGLVARKLFRSEVVAVASPTYLAAAGRPDRLEDLEHHTCLLGFDRGERPATHWPLLDGGRIRVRGRLIANDIRLLGDAAVRGIGIALLPRLLAGPQLENGDLEVVLEGVVGTFSQLALVYPDRRLLKPAVRAFVDHMVEWSPRPGSPTVP